MPGKKPQSKDRPRRPGFQEEMKDLSAQFSDLARRLFLSRPHSRDVIKSLPPLEMPLKIDFTGRGEDAAAEAARLTRQLREHIDDAILSHAAFRPGLAYCFFCETTDCSHGAPTDPKHVFHRYSQTGQPEWLSFLEMAMTSGNDRLDQLTSPRPTPTCLVSSKEDLVGERMRIFANGQRAYDLMGQVAFGYYLMNCDNGQEKFAVSLQLVRSATRSKVVRLGINTIGLMPDGRPATKLLEQREGFGFLEMMVPAGRRLSQVNQELRKCPPKNRMKKAAHEAEKLLKEMALGFGRKKRREGWRTGHANERAQEKSRPTGMARNDLESVRNERVFFDEREKTYVVMGGKGRTHIFNVDGLHVTSLHLERKSIDARLAQKRWRQVESGEVKKLLSSARRALDA